MKRSLIGSIADIIAFVESLVPIRKVSLRSASCRDKCAGYSLHTRCFARYRSGYRFAAGIMGSVA
jgi:hypothetical protein